jgi:hypothetical protein
VNYEKPEKTCQGKTRKTLVRYSHLKRAFYSTVRNDYNREYYFEVTGNLCTSGGEKIEGTKYIVDPPAHGFAVFHVRSHSVESFEVHFDYSKHDIRNYDLFLALPPFEAPPPLNVAMFTPRRFSSWDKIFCANNGFCHCAAGMQSGAGAASCVAHCGAASTCYV